MQSLLKCVTCGISLINISMYDHYMSKHPEYSISKKYYKNGRYAYTCGYCGATNCSLKTMINHVVNHHSEKINMLNRFIKGSEVNCAETKVSEKLELDEQFLQWVAQLGELAKEVTRLRDYKNKYDPLLEELDKENKKLKEENGRYLAELNIYRERNQKMSVSLVNLQEAMARRN